MVTFLIQCWIIVGQSYQKFLIVNCYFYSQEIIPVLFFICAALFFFSRIFLSKLVYTKEIFVSFQKWIIFHKPTTNLFFAWLFARLSQSYKSQVLKKSNLYSGIHSLLCIPDSFECLWYLGYITLHASSFFLLHEVFIRYLDIHKVW